MFSEFSLFAKVFFRTHRRALFAFFACEIIYLLGLNALYPSLSRHWFPEFRALDSLALYILPPAFIQFFIAVYLGIFFSMRSPDAWMARLPVREGISHVFAYAMLLFNLGFLVLAFNSSWVFFFDLTGVPSFVVLFFSPALAFLVSSRARSALKASAWGMIAHSASLIIAVLLFVFNSEFIFGEIFLQPMVANAFVALVGFSVLGIADPFRKKIARVSSLLVIGLALYVGLSIYLSRNTKPSSIESGLLQVRDRIHEVNKQCLSTENRTEAFLEELQKSQSNEEFKTAVEVKKALSILMDAPSGLITVGEMRRLWIDLERAKPLAPAWKASISIPRCAQMPTFSLTRRLIIAIQTMPYSVLAASEKKQVQVQLLRLLREKIESAFTLTEALIAISLLKEAVTQKMLEGVSSADVAQIDVELKELKKSARVLMDPYMKLKGLTEERLREVIHLQWEKEYAPTSVFVDRLKILVSEARVSVR